MSLVVYLALGQNMIHHFDALHNMRAVAAGELAYPYHVLYRPVAWAWTHVLDVFGVAHYEAMRALSSVGAALAAYGCHRAAVRLGLGGEQAVMVALGCASLPAVLHAATVVEIDGVEWGCFGVAWIPFATLLRTDRWSAAATTGVCTAVAAGFHGAGNLFAVSLCGWQLAWDWPRRNLARTAPRALLLLVVHAIGTMAIAWLGHTAGQAAMFGNTIGAPFAAELVPGIVWREFLLPYLPFGVLLLATAMRRDRRAIAVVFVINLCAYLVLTTLIFGHYLDEARYWPQGGLVERGSFLLGLAVPMVMFVVPALPRRLAWAAVVLSATSAVVQQRLADWPPDPPGYAEGLAEVSRQGPVHLLVADAQELAWIARRDALVSTRLAGTLDIEAARVAAANGQPVLADHFVIWFHAECTGWAARGIRFLITDRALMSMREGANANLAAAVAKLPEFCRLERVTARGFSAWHVTPR